MKKKKFQILVIFSHKIFLIFRVLASKIAIDASARLIHRESGKIILPYEHWANAIFLKHCERLLRVPTSSTSNLILPLNFFSRFWHWRTSSEFRQHN